MGSPQHSVGQGAGGAGDASESSLQAILAELTQKTEPANQQHVIIDSMPAGGAGLTDTELRATPVPISGTITFSNGTIAVTNAGTFAVQAAQAGTWNIGSITTLPAITFASPQAVTGPLTDTQLRASAVPVTANAGTNLNTSALSLEATQLLVKARTDNIPPVGQALAAASTPVVLPATQITTLTPPAAIVGFALEAGHLATIDTSTAKIPSQGQALAAASTPVVLPALQQAALTPPAAITGFALESTQLLQATSIKQEPLATSANVWTTEGARAPFSQSLDGRTRIFDDASPFMLDALGLILLELRVMNTVLHSTLNSRDDLDVLRRDALPTLN